MRLRIIKYLAAFFRARSRSFRKRAEHLDLMSFIVDERRAPGLRAQIRGEVSDLRRRADEWAELAARVETL